MDAGRGGTKAEPGRTHTAAHDRLGRRAGTEHRPRANLMRHIPAALYRLVGLFHSKEDRAQAEVGGRSVECGAHAQHRTYADTSL